MNAKRKNTDALSSFFKGFIVDENGDYNGPEAITLHCVAVKVNSEVQDAPVKRSRSDLLVIIITQIFVDIICIFIDYKVF